MKMRISLLLLVALCLLVGCNIDQSKENEEAIEDIKKMFVTIDNSSIGTISTESYKEYEDLIVEVEDVHKMVVETTALSSYSDICLLYYQKGDYYYFAYQLYGIVENTYFMNKLPSVGVINEIEEGMNEDEIREIIPGLIIFTDYSDVFKKGAPKAIDTGSELGADSSFMPEKQRVYSKRREKLKDFKPQSRIILDDGTILSLFFVEENGKYVLDEMTFDSTDESYQLANYIKVFMSGRNSLEPNK